MLMVLLFQLFSHNISLEYHAHGVIISVVFTQHITGIPCSWCYYFSCFHTTYHWNTMLMVLLIQSFSHNTSLEYHAHGVIISVVFTQHITGIPCSWCYYFSRFHTTYHWNTMLMVLLIQSFSHNTSLEYHAHGVINSFVFTQHITGIPCSWCY